LSFPEGALITNIERVDENWWGGEYDGKAGLFPCNPPSICYLLLIRSSELCPGSIKFRGDGCGGLKAIY
jgi:hypothetical protein